MEVSRSSSGDDSALPKLLEDEAAKKAPIFRFHFENPRKSKSGQTKKPWSGMVASGPNVGGL